MSEDTPGRRLERAIRAGMGRSGLANTISGLAILADLNRGTLYDWFNDTRVPSSASLSRIAKIIDVPARDLWDAYEGREPTPTSTEEAIQRLIGRLDRNSSENQALMRLIRRAMIAGFERAADEELDEPPGMPPPPTSRRRTRRSTESDRP
jgi:hypothetical protein